MAAVEALGARATEWLDRWWDEAAGMVGYPSTEGSPTNPYQQPGVHQVRESAVYAAALLERGAPGDGERAGRALEAVLAHQIDAPGSVTHGTWRRAPIEPVPGPEPREWIDYDPNWREFVGAAFVLALRHEARLAPGTVRAMERALRLAAEGTLDRAVPAEYTNIALLSAFLLDWAGDRLGEGAWRKEGEALGAAVADAYDVAGARRARSPSTTRPPTTESTSTGWRSGAIARAPRRFALAEPRSKPPSGATSRASTTRASATCAARTRGRTAWT
jgi:hypothetical protein